jgi:glycosyltransferase involved in cell wall biosynthesis
MKICMITKYPPIEGGVSSKAYWTAKALGELGHEVHVVTNALEVEDEYREVFDLSDPNYQSKNVYVHSTDPAPTIEANPCHIPFSKMYCEKLASLAIKVIEENDIDVIDSRFLVPYSVAGFIAKAVTGVPQVISHAGSDLQRLFPSPYLNTLLKKTLKNADLVISNSEKIAFLHELGVPSSKISVLPQIYVDTKAFNPQVQPFDLKPFLTNQKYTTGMPVIAFIGKVTYHFETKGLPKLIEACSKINKDFLLLFVANGTKIQELKNLIQKAQLSEKTLFMPFMPPWKMPSILKACSCVVTVEPYNSPVLSYHTSQIPAETMSTGCAAIISNDVYAKEPYTNFKNGKDLIAINAEDSAILKNSLEKLIGSGSEIIGKNAHLAFSKQRLAKQEIIQLNSILQSVQKNKKM